MYAKNLLTRVSRVYVSKCETLNNEVIDRPKKIMERPRPYRQKVDQQTCFSRPFVEQKLARLMKILILYIYISYTYIYSIL